MGFITLTINKDELTNYSSGKLGELNSKAGSFLDEIAEIYKDSMVDEAPEVSGETKRQTIWEYIAEFIRSVYSTVPWWDALVGGHAVYGPIFSDKQRRWWFWYLNTVLGGSYVNKTNGYYPGNDYPSIAFDNAEGSVDQKLEEFLDWLVD